MSHKTKGTVALLVAATLAGSFGVLSHYISFSIPLFYQMLLRNLTQLIIIVALMCIIRGRQKAIAKKDIKWFILRSACGFTNFICMYIAFTQISISTTYFLTFAASTICGYILGSALFGERIKGRGLVALGLSIAGLALVYSVSFQLSTIWYSVAALVAGIAAPGWSVFSKAISKTYSNLQMNFVDTAIATVIAFIITLGLKEQWVAIELSPIWIASFGFALIFLVVGFLIVYGFRYVEAEAGTLLLLFEVVAGIALGYLFLHQTIPAGSAVGGLMILGAICIQTYSGSGILHRTRHSRT